MGFKTRKASTKLEGQLQGRDFDLTPLWDLAANPSLNVSARDKRLQTWAAKLSPTERCRLVLAAMKIDTMATNSWMYDLWPPPTPAESRCCGLLRELILDSKVPLPWSETDLVEFIDHCNPRGCDWPRLDIVAGQIKAYLSHASSAPVRAAVARMNESLLTMKPYAPAGKLQAMSSKLLRLAADP